MEVIDKERFNELVKNNKKVIVFDFFATWCGPCRMLSPILEEINNENEKVEIYKIDVDNSYELAKQFGIMSVPTLIIFDKDRQAEKIVGYKTKEDLEQLLLPYIFNI